MRKSTAILIIFFWFILYHFFIVSELDKIINRITIMYFAGIYFIVKQLEENKTK